VGPLNRYGWWKRQDGFIRQKVIEQLMQQIMHHDGEFAVNSRPLQSAT
jgi:hypothetical protein